jgi:SNF2 family DNA or RNA helicase
MNAPPLFKHQEETISFLAANENAFISSDPGTGKSRTVLEHIRANKDKGRALIFAPKSILQASWGEDIKKFTPELTYSLAIAGHRESAFASDTNIVLINHDAAKWVAENIKVLKDFYTLCIDESTAFKHNTSQRSKAMEAVANAIPNRIAMTGTPNPNGIIDLFNQIKLVDGGQRLGKSYWAFRAATHNPVSKGAFTEWQEKPGIQDAVYGLIADINIRYELEKCLDMPENFINEVTFDLSSKHQRLYYELKQEAMLSLAEGDITAINAASLATKLMQAASGCVYGQDHKPILLTTDRYELIMDLIEARDQCVVAFQWSHQRDELTKLATARGFSYAVIDGSVSADRRNDAVNSFQAGQLKIIFAHPASAAHGLTLTKGTTTIWASPTYNAEHFVQFNRRIYRAGQTQRTETILISANNTIDTKAYARLTAKLDNMTSLLELLSL